MCEVLEVHDLIWNTVIGRSLWTQFMSEKFAVLQIYVYITLVGKLFQTYISAAKPTLSKVAKTKSRSLAVPAGLGCSLHLWTLKKTTEKVKCSQMMKPEGYSDFLSLKW